VTPITPGDALTAGPYRRACAICSGFPPSPSPPSPSPDAASAGLQPGTTLPPTVSVSCPDNAKLDDGSHFECKAGVTETGTTSQPGIKTHSAVVDVEIEGDKARWELRVTS
jgi:hypothetical protein